MRNEKKMIALERRKEILKFLNEIVFSKVDIRTYSSFKNNHLIILYGENIGEYIKITELEYCLNRIFKDIIIEFTRHIEDISH